MSFNSKSITVIADENPIQHKIVNSLSNPQEELIVVPNLKRKEFFFKIENICI